MSQRARSVRGLQEMVGPYVQVSLSGFGGELGEMGSWDIFEGGEEVGGLCWL